MKLNSLFPLAILFVCWMACKPAETKVEIPATLFTSAVVKHPVKDYNMWKPHFMAHDSVRMAYGIEVIGVARGLEDTNMVAIISRVGDLQKARDFLSMPELKTLMDSAGVTAAPTIEWINVVRNDTSEIAQSERLMISHHVKDFGAWLKVFDAEGKDTRAGFGLLDRALGRGVEDTNMVYMVFAITDMAKAKARGESEELKKLMEEAGVDGPQNIFSYKFDIYKE